MADITVPGGIRMIAQPHYPEDINIYFLL